MKVLEPLLWLLLVYLMLFALVLTAIREDFLGARLMSRESDKKELALLRSARARKTLTMRSGVLMSQKDAEDLRENYCGGCGKMKDRYRKLYFGEEFCGECVDKWLAGK